MAEYISRKEVPDYLATEFGESFRVSVPHLEVLAHKGGGPEFVKFGGRVSYSKNDIRAWVASKAIRKTSTSDPGQPLGGEAA